MSNNYIINVHCLKAQWGNNNKQLNVRFPISFPSSVFCTFLTAYNHHNYEWGTFNWSRTIGGKQNFTYTVPFPIVFSSRKWCMPSIPKVVFGQNGANVQTTYYTNNGVYIHAETGSMQVCAMSAKFDYIAIGV